MAKAKAKSRGRQKGSRNRGYFFIKDRGWVANVKGRRVPLEYENGDRMRDENIPLTDVKAAYFLLMAAPVDQEDVGDASELQVCDAYLATVEDTGAKSTLVSRENTLFDFCFGLPSRFVKRQGKVTPKPAKSDYIHSGFGKMSVSQLRPLHLDTR